MLYLMCSPSAHLSCAFDKHKTLHSLVVLAMLGNARVG